MRSDSGSTSSDHEETFDYDHLVCLNINVNEYERTQYPNMDIALDDGKTALEAFERLGANEVINVINPTEKMKVLKLFTQV